MDESWALQAWAAVSLPCRVEKRLGPPGKASPARGGCPRESLLSALRWARGNAPSGTEERARARQPWATPEAEEAQASPWTTRVYWSKETHLQTGAGRACVWSRSQLWSLWCGRGRSGRGFSPLPPSPSTSCLSLGKSLNFSALKEGMTLAP